MLVGQVDARLVDALRDEAALVVAAVPRVGDRPAAQPPGTRVRTTVPLPSTMSSRIRSGLRNLKRITATRVAQSHWGEKTFWTRGAVIGLGRVFRPCVTANAAAVPPSNATTRRVERNRGTAPQLYVATFRQPVRAASSPPRADGGVC